MPVSFEILSEEQVVFVRYHGVARVAETAAVFAQYMQHPDFRPGQRQLVDLSGLTDMDPDFPQLMELQAKKAEAFVTGQDETLVVYHAPNDMTLKMARVIERSWDTLTGVIIVVVQEEEAALQIMGLRQRSFESLMSKAR